MIQHYDYEQLMETSRRVNWRIEDIFGAGHRFDFGKPFLPESFARTTGFRFLTPAEQLRLNHIRGFGYLAMFELVERCILPVIDGLAATPGNTNPARTPALAQFAAEEEKHIELFVTFRRAYAAQAGDEPPFIGPADQIGDAIRAHGKLGLALFVLGIEWATQAHYVESVRDQTDLDPQFQSLLKHHWIEESQHAKLDALVFREIAGRSDEAALALGIDHFLAIGGIVDGGLNAQVELDLATLEVGIGRTLSEANRAEFRIVQLQAMRWTFLGSALRNSTFLAEVGAAYPAGRARIEQVAPAFC